VVGKKFQIDKKAPNPQNQINHVKKFFTTPGLYFSIHFTPLHGLQRD